MWALNWLPDFVFHTMVIVGVLALLVTWVLKFVPFVFTYRLPLQVGGVLLTVIGVWYEGGIAKDQEYKDRIQELEAKVTVAEAKAASVTEKIEYVTKERIVRVQGEIQKVIQRISEPAVAQVLDQNCDIPPEAVDAVNSAMGAN